MTHLKSIFLGMLLFFPLSSYAGADAGKQEAFLQELEAAKYALTFKYGPTEWKAQYLHWDADTAFEEIKDYMAEHSPQTTFDYQRIYRRFLGSLKDYHVSTLFHSTEWSAFPINARRVGDHYYISNFDFNLSNRLTDFIIDCDDMDFDRVDAELRKCHLGDEIIAINGVPTKEVIERLIDDEFFGDRTPTGYALATRMLFTRYGRRGHRVPSGDFSVTVKSLLGKTHTVHLSWLHVPEWVTEPTSRAPQTKWQKLANYLNRDFSVSLAKDMLKSPLKGIRAFDDDEEMDFREKSFVPPLGPVVWETYAYQDFYAYIFKNPQGKKIGYLYIPDFVADDDDADYFLDDLEEIIEFFEKKTEALVVDINDNPGGNLFYMYSVLSLLSDKPLLTPKHTEVLTQEDIYNTALMYNALNDFCEDEYGMFYEQSISGYPLTDSVVQKLLAYSRSILDQWKAGVKRTEPDYLFGIDCIDPHPETRYTKPILVLINELDFSCGDLFPAILQDNHRATLLGKKTAGAGGYVRPYYQTSQFGVMLYSLTGSLVYRQDGSVIENLGVQPDVEVGLTKRDLQLGYPDYIRTVNKQLKNILR